MIEALIKPAPASSISVRQACLALGVSQSAFFAHRHKEQRPPRQQDTVIATHLKEVFESTYHCYGSPRLVQSLRQRDVRCGKTRVRRLMQEHGLCARQKRRFRVQTTQSNPHLPCAPRVVGELEEATAPGERFHSDITYIPTEEGFLFLAATVDAYTRKCAGAPFGSGAPVITWKPLWSKKPRRWPLASALALALARFAFTIRIAGRNTQVKAFVCYSNKSRCFKV